MQRRTFVSHLFFAGAAAGFTGIPNALAQVAAQESDVANWSSDTVREAFGRFAATHRMPEDLNRWLTDPAIQCIKPYRVFDNVWNVGLKWVSAYLIDTGEGWVLIDTTHEPFVDHLIENIAAVGVALDDIRLVLMTHGHFDHVGGCSKLKPLLRNARFAMSERGWAEAFEDAKASQGTPRAWKMLEKKDLVLKDGDEIKIGRSVFKALETPGHTWGTVSYLYDVLREGRRYRAVTVGGLGLNAISGPEQLEAYIKSMRRLADPEFGIEVDMTAHPFSTGLTELIPQIVSLKPGDKHPLINRQAFLKQLEALSANARETLERTSRRS